MIIPTYLSYYVLSGIIIMIGAVLFGLHRALERAGWPAREREATFRWTAVILIGWCAAAIALALVDVYATASNRIPTIQYGILLPILIGTVMIWRSPALARLLDAVPQQWLIGVQLYRAEGLIFLILYATSRLPGLFAWPAGIGDVLVGVLAPVIAIAYARAPRQNADLVAAWNLFGLADLLIAVIAGVLTSPSTLQLFAFDLPNELVSRFPLVLVPTFLVPLSVLLHLASLEKLNRSALRNNSSHKIAQISA